MSTIIDERLAALANQYDAVAVTPVGRSGASAVLIARTADGTPKVVEVVDAAGSILGAEQAVNVLANVRRDAEALVASATEAVITLTALRQAAGEDVNLSAVARDAGIGRTTLHNRLNDLGLTAN